MNKLLWPILKRTAFALFVIVLAIFLYGFYIIPEKFSGVYFFIPLIPAFINFTFISKLINIYNLSINLFYNKYLLFNGIKFLLNLLVFIVLIFLFQPDPILFIVVYLLSYFIFFVLEIFEISALVRKLK